MKPYPAYKDSRIEWVGQVPKDWSIKRLKFVVDINPPRLAGIDDERLCVFIPMEAMKSDGTFDQSSHKPVAELKTGFTCFAKDDVIFAKITPCFENGKGALLAGLGTDIGFGSTEFHVLLMRKGKTIPRFLYYLSVSGAFRRLGEAFMQGVAGQKRVTNDFVCDFVAGIPSTAEQEQILGKYLFWLLSADCINYQFRIEASGVTRYGLSNYALSNFMCLIPPKEEQEAHKSMSRSIGNRNLLSC